MTSFSTRLGDANDELATQGAGLAAQIPDLPMFQSRDMQQTAMLTLGAVMVLTLTNAMAAKFATGGHALKLLFYGSIMLTVSGINLTLIPPVAQGLLTR